MELASKKTLDDTLQWVKVSGVAWAGDGFFYPAYGGIVPLVVDEHHLASANALTGPREIVGILVLSALGRFFSEMGKPSAG